MDCNWIIHNLFKLPPTIPVIELFKMSDVNNSHQETVDESNSNASSNDLDINSSLIGGNARLQRQRTMLQPLNPSHVGTPLFLRLREVSLNTLSGEEAFTVKLNRKYLLVQLIRIISPGATQKANIYSSRRKFGTNAEEVTFSRLFLCRVHTEEGMATDHGRLIYLMQSRSSNKSLFEDNKEWRDNGTFTIGTFFRVLSPLPVENNMSGDIPLVKTGLPIIIMKRPSRVPHVPINFTIQGNSALAFVYNNINLELTLTTPVQTTCGGYMCDRQRVSDWNGVRGCGCFDMSNYRSNLAFEHSIHFDTNTGKISHQNFSSTKFSLIYMNDYIPGSVKVSALRMSSNSDAFFNLEDAIDGAVGFINDNDGWTATGWYKRGIITDKTLVTSGVTTNANKDTSEQVDAGQLTYHVIELLPTDKTILDKHSDKGQELQKLKYDVSQLPQV